MTTEDEDEFPHVSTEETDEEAQDLGPACNDNLDSEVDDFTIKKDDHVFMTMVHPVDPQHFVRASSTVSVRGHPSVSLLPLSFPTLPLSICTPYPHLCIISKDRTYSRRPPGLMVRRLPAFPPARPSTASDGLRTHRDRST
jgi:hypothetical protein